MEYPLGLIHRLLLPFYPPEWIARLLSNKAPRGVAIVLETLKLEKSFATLKLMPENFSVQVLNSMGARVFHLLRRFRSEERAKLLIQLHKGIVTRYCKVMEDAELMELDSHWSERDQFIVIPKLTMEKAQRIVDSQSESNQIKLLTGLQPWIRAALLAKADDEKCAKVLERLPLQDGLDLFDRWDMKKKADVLLLLSKEMRVSIIDVQRPGAAAHLMAAWPDVEVLLALQSLETERRIDIISRLSSETQAKTFPLFPLDQQTAIIERMKPMDAALLLVDLPEEDVIPVLDTVEESIAMSIRIEIKNIQGLRRYQ